MAGYAGAVHHATRHHLVGPTLGLLIGLSCGGLAAWLTGHGRWGWAIVFGVLGLMTLAPALNAIGRIELRGRELATRQAWTRRWRLHDLGGLHQVEWLAGPPLGHRGALLRFGDGATILLGAAWSPEETVPLVEATIAAADGLPWPRELPGALMMGWGRAPDTPQLGSFAGYQLLEAPITLTAYIYEAVEGAIPAGADSERLAAAFDRELEGVMAVAPQAKLAPRLELSERGPLLVDGQLALRTATLRGQPDPDGPAISSTLALAGRADGRLFKLRWTSPLDAAEALSRLRPAIEALVRSRLIG